LYSNQIILFFIQNACCLKLFFFADGKQAGLITMKKTTSFICGIALLAACFPLFSCNTPKGAAGKTTTAAAGKKEFYFLFLSDVHLSTNITQSVYGQDAGTDLWSVCKTRIDSILRSPNPPAFILYTGDIPEHGGISDTSLRNRNIDNLLADLHSLSAVRNTPVFYLPGNNDGLDGDYCLFANQAGRTPLSLLPGYAPYPYQAFNVYPTPVAGKAYMRSGENLTAGYYAAQVMPGLRILSLNSVIWSNQLCAKCAVTQDCNTQQADGDKQMAWLQQQLAAAATAGDKVYIAMHIPPGADAYATSYSPASPVYMWRNGTGAASWQNKFLAAVALYSTTVAGVFYGHTHMDEFRLLYDQGGVNCTQVAISCPGISPMFGNNPGFKLVTVNGSNKLPLDYITYYATVSPIAWQQPYRFSQQPGVKNNTSIYDALRQMKPAERNNLLNGIYKVKHGVAAYDTLGIDVRWIK
jgi:3',5'-cyclic AMP phosphodiesterase CpdA